MQYKYRVEILDNSTGEVKESQKYKTKKNIIEKYSIPMYIVDKIIKKTNDSTFTIKRDSHLVYRDLMNTMRIEIIKPNF
jgi:hypothetical protein